MTRPRVAFIAAAVIAATSIASTALAQAKPDPPKAPPSVAGKWNISLDPGSGPLQLATEFKVDGTKVTGTLIGPQGESLTLQGEYTGGKLSFAVTAPDGNTYSFKGAFKEDGTLAGMVAGPDGTEIAWTATRAKD